MTIFLLTFLLFGIGILFIFTAANQRARHWMARNNGLWKLSKSDEERELHEALSLGMSIIMGATFIGLAIAFLTTALFE